MKVKHSKKTNQEKKIIELDINPVREYLKENPTKKLSIRYLKTHLTGHMKIRQIYYYCTHSNFIERSKPFEVGSHKTKLNVFNYKI